MALPVRVRKVIPNRGLYSAAPEDSIDAAFTPRCLNVRFKFNECRGTPGRDLLSGPIIASPVRHIQRFIKIDETDWATLLTDEGLWRWGNTLPSNPRKWHRVLGPTLTSTERYGVTTGEGYLFFSKGLNGIYRWSGLPSDAYELLPVTSGVAPPAKHLEYYNNRLIAMNTVESGETRSNRIRWPANANHLDWNNPSGGSGFLDLYDGAEEPIQGGRVLNDRLVVYRDHTITEVIKTGTLTPVFESQTRINGLGCRAPWTLASTGEQHFFLASDRNVYAWDGTRLDAIGAPILDQLEAIIDPALMDSYFAGVFNSRQEYWLVINETDVFVYDYGRQSWSRDSLPNITALAEVSDLLSTAELWSTITTFWHTETRRWNDAGGLVFPVLFAGREDGATFKIDENVIHDYFAIGSIVDRYVETPDFYFEGKHGAGDPASLGTVQRLILIYEFIDTVPFEVAISFDHGSSWSAQEVTPSETGYSFVDFNMTGNVVRYRFRENNATGRFRWRSCVYDFIPAGDFFPAT